MRKRNVDTHIMLTEDEHDALIEAQRKTGLHTRELILNAISEKPFITTEYTDELRNANETLSKLYIELHKIGVNINQLARVANTTGDISAEYQLYDIDNKLNELGKECEDAWRFIRRSITGALAAPEHTER